MAFSLLQAGSALQMLDSSGVLTTLTLPAGVTIDATKFPRFAIFGRYVVMVNSPTRPLTIGADGTVRVLCPQPPVTPPSLSGVAGGALTGNYRVRETFVIEDEFGNTLAESAMGPASASASISSQYLKVSGSAVAPVDAITKRREYRTTTNGAVYFSWVDIDGNVQTSVQDDLSDASLSLLAAPTLGSPPNLTLIAEWRDRLWGAGDVEIDTLRFSEAGTSYAWPVTNGLLIPRPGSDTRGVTALMARRESLGVGRRDVFHSITGTSLTDFRVVKLSDNLGVESQESVVVYRDTAYFLWKDGVYTWGADGIKCLSDGEGGKGMVRSWFTTDSYFNRDQFISAFAHIDPIMNKYRLFLASAGSSTVDRWVEYDLRDRTWWGPHKTNAFSPSCAFVRPTANDVYVPSVGSTNAYVWQEQSTRTDGGAVAIPLDIIGKFHDGGIPDIQKYFGQMALISKIQPSADTLAIIPTVGGMDATAGATINADMTLGRERLRRLGTGRYLRLEFTHSTVGKDVELWGYDIPFQEVGRR